MTDYGHDPWFGVFVPPVAEQSDSVLELARRADAVGLDVFAIQDHPYQPAFLDAWTLLSALAVETARIRLFPDVANLPLRLPSVLARSAASIDILSDGRFELGLGAGAFWNAIEANGGPRRTPGEALVALEEAMTIIRAIWTPGRGPRVDGKHYRVWGPKTGPQPPHRIGIWVGGYGPRMLKLIGRLADGWVPSAGYLPPDQLGERSRRRLLEHLSFEEDELLPALGRLPASI
jgi:alkanesulfonate monooxygenase SsuD/methylene tetrahydromethanopterin reductase-like flavin-dependent oxidoreductase (luciferase family)